MSKNVKKVNPYEKKKKRSLKITRKQWTVIIALLCAVALIVGIIIAGNLRGNGDEHYEGDGHNHGSSDSGEHYEGDGHNHGSNGTTSSTDKVKYRYYTNEDKTYRVQVLNAGNKVVFEKDKLTNVPIQKEISDTIVELGWATGSGANDFEAIYWNKETGNISQLFWAPRGTDGVRIAYPSEDQTKIIVQDLFDKDFYCKEYELKNAAEKNGNIITGGKLHDNKKTVIVSYNSSETESSAHATINLYEN